MAGPAAHSVPHLSQDSGGAPNTLRLPSTACDAFDAESHQPAGRAWVKELSSAGYSCHVSEAVLRANLARLPPRDPILILADGGRALPERLAERASNELRSEFRHVGDVVALLGLDIRLPEWPSVELAACAAASTLLLNRYSPLSALLERRASRRAVAFAESADGSAAAPRSLWWMRVGSDRCVPLFTRTCRFDLQPNRFGILGQFGPERKLQLQTYNVSSLIGWDGRVTPNASIELEVYVSNESHALATFEYTKDNNKLGLTFVVPPPAGGWRAHTWQPLVLPIRDRHYSFPRLTPWDNMDRLELYYAHPHQQQQRGDYVRIRNVYLRSSTQAPSSETARYTPCHDLAPVDHAPARRPSEQLAASAAASGGRAAPPPLDLLPAPAVGAAGAAPAGADAADPRERGGGDGGAWQPGLLFWLAIVFGALFVALLGAVLSAAYILSRTHRSQPLSSTEARVALGLGARQMMELAGGSKAKGDEDV